MALTPAEKQKRYRERRRMNAEKEEENKRKDRERGKKRTPIQDKSARAQRAQRKSWRITQKNCREKKSKLCSTPTPSTSSKITLQTSANKISGRKRVLLNRSKVVRENFVLKKEIKKLKLVSEKYRKRFHRLKVKCQDISTNSPKSRAKRSLNECFNGQLTPRKSKIVRQLTLFNALTDDLKSKYATSNNKEKRNLKKLGISSSLKKYRLLREGQNSYFGCRVFQKPKTSNKSLNAKRVAVTKFFLRDDVSRASAGKKETITKNKVKMQKRYLQDTLKNLHSKYTIEVKNPSVSFTSFTRLRPFYVCAPTVDGRNTCACEIHENMSLKAQALHRATVIETKDLQTLVKKLSCDENNKRCMYGHCNNCKEKNIETVTDKSTDTIKWQLWCKKKEEREKIVNGTKKCFTMKITSKQEMNTSIAELLKQFNSDMGRFKKHIFNIKQQYIAYKDCKDNLKSNEAMLHIDFSENYMCKLGTEIQSYHFGGSRNQATLHTGVMYLNKLKNPVSFCTISPSHDHSPAAIWAHLQPILNQIKVIAPEVDSIHFFSDGPSTQYRQKKNFFLFNKYIAEDDNLKFGSWSFFEAGHGKGAADGIGGVIKRTADLLVAQGADISDSKDLFNALHLKTNIQLHYIPEDSIEIFKKVIPEGLRILEGTMKVHQIFSDGKDIMPYRDVSCYCRSQNICGCFKTNDFHLSCNNKCTQKKKTRKRQILSEVNCDSSLEGSFKNPKGNIEKSSFVLVKLLGKKRVKYYVAEIINAQGESFRVKYLKKVRNQAKFYREDNKEYEIEIDDIEMKLPNPIQAGNSERQLQYLTFNVNLTKYDVE